MKIQFIGQCRYLEPHLVNQSYIIIRNPKESNDIVRTAKFKNKINAI